MMHGQQNLKSFTTGFETLIPNRVQAISKRMKASLWPVTEHPYSLERDGEAENFSVCFTRISKKY